MWEEAFESYYEALCRYVPGNSEKHKNTDKTDGLRDRGLNSGRTHSVFQTAVGGRSPGVT
jgi:hypothetical protein